MIDPLEVLIVGLGYGGMLVAGSGLGTLLAIGGHKKKAAIFLFALLASLGSLMIGAGMTKP